MSRQIITSWGEVDQAVDTLLPLAESTIMVFDRDLSFLKLDSVAHADQLRIFLSSKQTCTFRIAVQDPEPFLSMPRLLDLLGKYGRRFQVQKTPAKLAHLNDSMLLINNVHALVRFHQAQVRSKILIDEPDECADYVQRFENIWEEGGTPISADTLGL